MVRRGIGVLLALALPACGVFALADLAPLDDAGTSSDASLGDADTGTSPDAHSDGPTMGDAACADPDPCKCLRAPEIIQEDPFHGGAGIAVSATDVYFLEKIGSDVTVYRTPLGADAAARVQMTVSSPGSGPLVFAGNALYFRRVGTGLSVLRVPIDSVDAGPVVLNGDAALASAPADLGADATRIYWSNSLGEICAWPLNAAPQNAGDSGCIGAPLVPARDGGGPSNQIALNATTVFWSSYARILRAPIDKGLPVSLVVSQNPDSLSGLAESQGYLFWAALGNDASTIFSMPDDGTNLQGVIPSPFDDHSVTPTFTVDGDGIYWGDSQKSGLIMAAGRDGSGRRLIACDSGMVAIVTDPNYVYWITISGGVKRLPKK